MGELKDIVVAQWNNGYCTTPNIVEGPDYNPDMYRRVVHITPYRKVEDYMGIIDRAYYTPDSEDMYTVVIASSTSKADLDDMINEFRRICSQYSSGDDRFILWTGGEYTIFTNWRYEFEFTVSKRKSGVEIPNAI